MQSDQTIARFADLHAGFKLVDRRDVALPFFELRLDVMAERRQELPVIDEYLLRFAKLGLQTSSELEGVLGLERSVVQRSLLSLLQADHVDYVPGEDGREVRLTQSGELVLVERLQNVPERTEVHVGFDRLLWRLSPRWMTSLETPRMFKGGEATLLKPLRGRRPELSDVDLGSLNRALKELPFRRRDGDEIDVVQTLDIGARTKYLRAEMLVFVADDNSAIRASFVLDGHHSVEHDRAFAEAGGLTRLGIELADPGLAKDETLRLPPELEALRPSEETAKELATKLRSATRLLDDATVGAEVADVVAEVTSAAGSTRERLRSREAELARLREELESLRLAQESLSIRSIQTYEHPELLTLALAASERRLLLITPWVKTEVVNDAFVRALRLLCEKGVRIYIGYGFTRGDDAKNDPEALKRLSYLSAKHENFVLSKLGNTHAKVLVWDDSMVVTSFNWLSFQGDRRRQYRQEEGTLIRVPQYVDAEFDRHAANIQDAASS